MAQDQTDESLRKHVLYLLRDGGAHLSFDDFVKSFPPDLCNRQIDGLPYTPWQVLEHIRLAQWDILEFSYNAKHKSPEWPEGYWPKKKGTAKEWKKSVTQILKDLKAMRKLVVDKMQV